MSRTAASTERMRRGWKAPHGARRCGHRPDAPNLAPAWISNPRHPLLARMVRELPRRIYWDRARGCAALLKRRSDYRKRTMSPRLEAVVKWLTAVLPRCDLRERLVGRWDEHGRLTERFDLHDLWTGAGISPWRNDRVIADLVAAGWVYRRQGRDFNKQWRGHVAHTRLTGRLFVDLGVSAEELNAASEAAHDLEHARAKRESRQRPAPVIAELLGKIVAPIAVAVADLQPLVRDEDRLAWNQMCFRLGREFPSWDADRVRAEAARLINERRIDRPPPKR